MKKEDRGQLTTFGAASFLNDLGAEIINPVWPLFLSIFLGASTTMIGFIDGLGDSIVSLSQFFSGYLSDRVRKRKVFIWLGYFFSSLSKLGYGLAVSLWQIIPLRILDRSGKMRDAPRDAIVAEISARKERGRNFGFLNMMDRAGAVCGIVVSIILFQFFSYRPIFVLAAIPPFLAFLVVAIFAKERKDHYKAGVIHKGVSFKKLDGEFKRFLFISAVFSISVFSYSFLLLSAAGIGFNLALIPVFYLIFNLVASVSSIPFGKLADKIGRKPVLMISYALWALVSVMFIFYHSFIPITIAFCIYGLYRGSIDPIQSALVSELAPKKYKASALGIFKMVFGIFALPASIIAGVLWQFVNPHAMFYFSLVLSLVAIALLSSLKEEPVRDED